MNPQVKTFIDNARKAGKSEAEIYDYLDNKGMIPDTIKATVTPPAEEKSVGGFLGNVVKSGAELGKGIVSAVAHPIDTVKNLGNLALGLGENIIGYEGEANKMADKVGEFYKQRYGGLSNIGETLYNDPIGALADLSTLAGGAGAALRGTASVAKVAELGNIAKTAGTIGRTATRIGELTDPLMNAGRIAKGSFRYALQDAGHVAPTAETAAQAGKLRQMPTAQAAEAAPVNTGIVEKIKQWATNKNIDEQTKTAIKNSDPAAVTAKYDKYAKAEEAYKADAKKDTALSIVGDDIGKAYDSVIQKRRGVGAKLGEARQTATSPVPVKPAIEKLTQELENSGLSLIKKDGVTKARIGKDGTSLSQAEVGMMKSLYKGLNALEKRPTAQAVSNFKTSMASEFDAIKGKSGITKSTNSDRIAKLVYKTLDEGLNNEKAPDLLAVHNLEKEYERLSKLLGEGEGYLGKRVAETGDYVRDSGLAKASIKSLHADAKKDFLMRLGKETGNDFIEDALIAAQAMKDAGNFKQASLLEELATKAEKTGELPASLTEIAGMGVRGAVRKATSQIAGTPQEMTRAFINGDAKAGTPIRGSLDKLGGQVTSKIRNLKDKRIVKGLRQIYDPKNYTRNATVNKAVSDE